MHDPTAPIDFAPPAAPEVGIFGRRVVLRLGPSLAYLDADAAAELATQLQAAEADVRGLCAGATPSPTR